MNTKQEIEALKLRVSELEAKLEQTNPKSKRCDHCGGSGQVAWEGECYYCGGTGVVATKRYGGENQDQLRF